MDKLFFGKNVVIVSAMQILPRSAWIVTHRATLLQKLNASPDYSVSDNDYTR